MNGFEANRLVEGGEDAILTDASKLMSTHAAELEELRMNQQQLVGVLFRVALKLKDGAILLGPSAEDIALEVLDHVHHDGLGKTLGQVVREGDRDGIKKILAGK